MKRDDYKNGCDDPISEQPPNGEEQGYALTTEISQMTFTGEIPIRQRVCLEIIDSDEKNEIFELGDGEIIIGRSSLCEIQLSVDNVSRQHARVVFRNGEYYVEDMDSTNGVYVNGIKTVKCILRNKDMIDIGGVKMLFHE